MRLLHTADLHLGKTVFGYSMLLDQEFVLRQIERTAKEEGADALILAGDIYDRATPSREAVRLLDGFLTRLSDRGLPVLMISGNHDSPERLGFGREPLKKSGIYIAGEWTKETVKVVLEDRYGPVNFYLLPFARLPLMNERLGSSFASCTDCLLEAVNRMNPDPAQRNVLITHHFVTGGGSGPVLSDSETAVSVGGLDNVDSRVFEPFDYTALGHIHGPQWIGRPEVCYAGSPLKYSFSEAGQHKSAVLVELKEKGEVSINRKSLVPLHEMRVIKGRLSELIREDVASVSDREDYLQALLTDEEELLDPLGALRAVYPNVMQLVLLKNRKEREKRETMDGDVRQKDMLELYREFFRAASGRELDWERERIIRKMLEEGKEEGV